MTPSASHVRWLPPSPSSIAFTASPISSGIATVITIAPSARPSEAATAGRYGRRKPRRRVNVFTLQKV